MSPTQASIRRIGYAPITRIDTARREIEVTATSEALDAYGTIFAYEASRDAFARWLGNVREMHDAVAVGKRVAVAYDPDRRAVRVRLRISQGAESTWQKILDGTLCGASIGAANVTWQEMARDQLPDTLRAEPNLRDTVRVATAYDLVELSLVDSPANPDCIGITLIRGAMPEVDLLDPLDDGEALPEPVDTVVTASPPGSRSIFGATPPKTERGSEHEMRAGETDTRAASEAQRLMLVETRRLAATMAALYA
nr:hypothetical protein [Ktedonobacterales bacterium]